MDKSKADNRSNICKDCKANYRKLYYFSNRENEIEASRKWNKTNPERARANRERWSEANQDKILAHRAVKYALRSEEIIRTGDCSVCGESGKTEFHHPDYSKPLLVTELCVSCHNQKHIEIRGKQNIARILRLSFDLHALDTS